MFTVVFSKGESVQYCSGMFETTNEALDHAKKMAKKKAHQSHETWTKAGFEVHTTSMRLDDGLLSDGGMLVETVRTKDGYKDVDIAYFHVAEIKNNN